AATGRRWRLWRDIWNGQLVVVHDAQARHHLRGRERAVPGRGEQRVEVMQVRELGRSLQVIVADVRQGALGDALQLAIEELASVHDVLLALLAFEPLADLLARAGGADHRDPVARGPSAGLAREDLDDVAGWLLVIVRHDTA